MRKTRHWKVQNNMNKVEKKRQKEQYIVEEMIRLYCRKNHLEEERQGRQMCPVCQELSDYAKLRSHKCPFMEQKTFCANCKVHCYKPEKREQIRQVMRFSGPRMLLHHPILAIWHLICSKREAKVKTYDKDKTGGTLIPCEKVYCIYDSMAVDGTSVTGIGSFFDCRFTGTSYISKRNGSSC